MKKDVLKIIENEKEKSLKKVKSATYKIDESLVIAIEKISKYNKINKNTLIEKILFQADIIEIADEIETEYKEEIEVEKILNNMSDEEKEEIAEIEL